jgi:beta-glucosidase
MGKDFRWPKGFLWGAATASHQVEGNNVNNWTEWELHTASEKAKAAKRRYGDLASWPEIKELATSPDNYVSGIAADHFRRYKEDFNYIEEMNLNAFRFSIEWSRIEPDEGAWDIAALEYYRTYIKELRARGIEPVVTLFHWTTPLWFTKKGGFEKSGNIHYFVRYCERLLKELGGDIRYICTINEPDTVVMLGYGLSEHAPGVSSLVKMLAVYINLLKTHRKVYKMAKKLNKKFIVGFVKSYANVHALDDHFMTKIAVRLDYLLRDDIVLWFVGKQTDFYGVNYYFSDEYSGWNRLQPDAPRSDLGWTMVPERLEDVLMRVGRRGKPIIITETGVADQYDRYRKDWITKTVVAVQNAIEAGVKVKGYFHWTLTDNFEWAFGRWPAFGLVKIDYEHGRKRIMRGSGKYYGAVVKNARKKEKGR